MANIITDFRSSQNKLFVKILLFILSASFIFWGVAGKMMTGSNVAVTVAGKQISVVDVDRELRRQVEQMRSMMGGAGFDARQAMRMGFLKQIVDNMVYRELLDAKAEGMYLVPADAQIYEMIIKSYPEFKDEQGNFSSERFAYLLQVNNISEKEFVNAIAKELARAMLGATLTGGVNSDLLAKQAASAAAQERIVDVATIRLDALRIQAKPGEDELRALYEGNLDMFKEMEFRKISLITVTEAAAKKVRPGAQGDALYRVMIEIAENIIDEKNGGNSNALLAKNFGVELLSLGPVNTDGILKTGGKAPAVLTPRLRDIAFFALDEGGISDIQDVGDTIVLVVLDEIIPAAPKPIAEVKSELEKLWLRKRQEAEANETASALLSRLLSGEDFVGAVAAVDKSMQFRPNLKLTSTSPDLPQDVLGRVFNAEKDKPFSLRGKDGYYVAVLKSVRLPNVEPTAEQRKEADEAMKALMLSDYVTYLERKLGVNRNETVLNRFSE